MTVKGLSYVNRQKGSGTRILCDYLCKKDGVDSRSIYGQSPVNMEAMASLIDDEIVCLYTDTICAIRTRMHHVRRHR